MKEYELLAQWLDVKSCSKEIDAIECMNLQRAAKLIERLELLEKDSAMLDWMQENFLCADFRYGEPATEVIVIEMPRKSRVCGDLRTDISNAMQQTKG